MGPRFIALAVSLIAGSASGCALVESAAEVTVGKGQLPRLEVAFDLPSVDDLVGDGLPSRIQGEPLTGVPGSLQATTLGHLQGVLGLSGSCLRTHAIASDEPEEGKESAVADVQVEIIGCPTGGWCSAWCGEQTGVMLRFGAEMTFIDDKKAANVRKQLSAEVGDAIAQIRVRFLQLTLEAGGLDPAATIALVQRFDIDLIDDQGGKARLLERRHLAELQSGEPMRLELDPDSGVTEQIRRSLEDGEGIALRVEATLVVAQGDLIAWPVAGTRMELTLQPEIVLSTVSLAKGFL